MSTPDYFSMSCSVASTESFSSLPEAPSSDSPDSHEMDSTSEESHQVAVPIRKGEYSYVLTRTSFKFSPRKMENQVAPPTSIGQCYQVPQGL